jgi:hypothetical protein
MGVARAVRGKLHSLFRRPIGRRYVFIVTYGRSGSTLLMNIINSCEGCCIRGENNAALYNIYESYKNISAAKGEHESKSLRPTSAWWGIHEVNPEVYARRLAEVFIEEVIKPKADDLVCGFKEIRFSKKDVPDLQDYIDFMKAVFPGAKFVFNHRNISDVASSKWWNKTTNAGKIIGEMDERLSELRSPESIFHFYYDKALQERSHVQEMLAFLGLTYEEEAVEKVFTVRHSY